MNNVLALAQKVGLFFFVTEAGEFAHLRLHFPDVALSVIDVQTQFVQGLGFLINAVVSNRNLMPERLGRNQHLLEAFQLHGTFLQLVAVLS